MDFASEPPRGATFSSAEFASAEEALADPASEDAACVLVVLMFLTGPLQYLPRCVLASIVFTIAAGMVDVKGLSDIRRESPAIPRCAFHRGGCAGNRRRAGHSSRDRSLPCPTRPPQLPAAHDGAGAALR